MNAARVKLGLCEDYLTSSTVWKRLDNLEKHLQPALGEDWTTEFSRLVREDLDSFQSSDLPQATRDEVRYGVALQAVDFVERHSGERSPARYVANLAYGAAHTGGKQDILDDCLKTLQETSNHDDEEKLLAQKALQYIEMSPKPEGKQRVADEAVRTLCGSRDAYTHQLGVDAVSSPTTWLPAATFTPAVTPALERLIQHQQHPAAASPPPSGLDRGAMLDYARTALGQDDFRGAELKVLQSPLFHDDEVAHAMSRSSLYMMSDDSARAFLGKGLEILGSGSGKAEVARLGLEGAAAVSTSYEKRLAGQGALDQLSFDPYAYGYHWPWSHSTERKISHLAQGAVEATIGFAGGGAKPHEAAVKIQQEALTEIARLAQDLS